MYYTNYYTNYRTQNYLLCIFVSFVLVCLGIGKAKVLDSRLGNGHARDNTKLGFLDKRLDLDPNIPLSTWFTYRVIVLKLVDVDR